MVDRRTFYYGQIPLDSDLLMVGQDYMAGIAKLSEAVLGTSAALAGLSVGASSPAALTVLMAPGMIYQQANLEATALGSLGTTLIPVVKQGVNLNATTVPSTGSFVAPTTPGYSVNILIEVQYQDLDGALTVLPYRNAAQPTVPFNGPGNTGVQQSTTRQGIVGVQAKIGIAATTGTQLTPTPDAGWVGLSVVTLAYGQTAITAANIAAYGAPPFIPVTLPGIPSAIQNGLWRTGVDTGAQNAIVFTPSPAITAYVKGQRFRVQIGYYNTGATVMNMSGLGNVPVVRTDQTPLRAKDIVPGMEAEFTYDGTSMQLLSTSPYGWSSGRYYGHDVGTTNMVVVGLDASFVSYIDGTLVGVYIANTNTGAVQLNANSLGLIPITMGSGTPLTAGAITAGTIAWMTLDGVEAQLINPQNLASGAGSLPANWNTIAGPLRPYFIAAISATVTVPPSSPSNGDTYLIPVGATGAWASNVGKIVQWNSGWVYVTYPMASVITAGDTGRTFQATAAGWTEVQLPTLGKLFFYAQIG